jgi:hypothetical protein
MFIVWWGNFHLATDNTELQEMEKKYGIAIK